MILETRDDVFYAMDTCIDSEVEPWKFGSTETFVIQRDDKFYEFTVQVHAMEGLQFEGPVECYEVERYTKTVTAWRRV